MSNSSNSFNQSAGFVYFNTSGNQPQAQQEPNKLDTPSFLAFSDSPKNSPPQNRFQPNHYSSPQYRFNQQSPRNNFNNRGRFNKSPRGNWSPNSSNSSRSSYNSFQNYNKSANISTSGEDDYERFIHPSFMENPWAYLETRLVQGGDNQQRTEKDVSNSSI